MSNEKYNSNLMVGAAVVAGILGTLSAIVNSNRSVKGWTAQAKDVAQQVLEKGEVVNKKMMLGGVAGGLIGAAAALLLAPKAGSELLKDLTHPFGGHDGHGSSHSHHSTSSSKKKPSRSSSKGSVTHKTSTKTEENKHQKKPSTRRRTAVSKIKKAVKTPEKIVEGLTET